MGALLVAYASKNGSTAEVAEHVAGRLRSLGHEVEVREALSAKVLTGWDAVVVGAPIYSGHWRSGGHRVMKKLSKIPVERRPSVAVFALGPRMVEGHESWVRPRQQFEAALRKHPGLVPLSTALFGGMDPPKKKQRRDARDWQLIQSWADELHEGLAKNTRFS